MTKYTYTFLIILMACAAAYPMSFFSSHEQGIGLRQYIPSVRGMGMGNTGLGLPDAKALNAYNIATWRYIENTRFSIMMEYGINTIDFGWQNFTTSAGKFQGLQLAVPIKKNKWVFGISITPYTNVDFSYSKKYPVSSDYYDENIFYEGSINRSQVNLAWSPHQRLGLGLSFNYYFGNIEDRYHINFNNPAISNSFSQINHKLHGPGVGVSFDYQVLNKLHFGGFFDIKPVLDLTTVTTSPITFEKQEVTSDASLPQLWGIGSSFNFADQWTMSADMVYQNWSRGIEIEGIDLNQFENLYKIGAGIEHAYSNKRKKSFLNQMDIRTGFSFGNLGYKFSNESVKEHVAHFGIGVPFFNDLARFDLAFMAGIRGDRSKNMAQEKFFRFIFSISAGELWFQKLR